MHDLKILHRDIKSANFFLFKCGQAKIGDLNVSKVQKQQMLQTQTGTPYYAAPEVWKELPYDHKSDVWSFGCVIYEMCCLQPPFKADDMAGLYKKVLRAQYPNLPTHFSMDMRTIVKTLLRPKPEERPDCGELLNDVVVQKRIRKYFSEGDAFELLKCESDDILLKTIYLKKPWFTQPLPVSNYEYEIRYY